MSKENRQFTFTHKGKVKKIDLSSLSNDEYNHFINLKGIANKLNYLAIHKLEEVPNLPNIIDLKSQALQPHKLVSRKQQIVDELKKYKDNHPDDVDKPLAEIKDSLFKETSLASEDFKNIQNKTLNEVLNMYISEVENLNIQNVNSANISTIKNLTTNIENLSNLINEPFKEALLKFTNNIETKDINNEEITKTEIDAMKLAAEERFNNLYSLLQKHANESTILKQLLDSMNIDLEALANNLDTSTTNILNKIQTESGKKELINLIEQNKTINETIESLTRAIDSTHVDLTDLSRDEKEIFNELQKMKPKEVKEILQDSEFKKVVDDILSKIDVKFDSIQDKINQLNNNNFGLNQQQQEILNKLNKLNSINFEELTQKQLQQLNQALININSLSKLSDSDIQKLNELITNATKESYKVGYDVNTIKTGLINELNNLTRLVKQSRAKDKRLFYFNSENNQYQPLFESEFDYKEAEDNPLNYYKSLIEFLLKKSCVLAYKTKQGDYDMLNPYSNLTNYIINNKGAIEKFIDDWNKQGQGIFSLNKFKPKDYTSEFKEIKELISGLTEKINLINKTIIQTNENKAQPQPKPFSPSPQPQPQPQLSPIMNKKPQLKHIEPEPRPDPKSIIDPDIERALKIIRRDTEPDYSDNEESSEEWAEGISIPKRIFNLKDFLDYLASK